MGKNDSNKTNMFQKKKGSSNENRIIPKDMLNQYSYTHNRKTFNFVT
jgi:hypothetical protein